MVFKNNKHYYELREYHYEIGNGYDVQITIRNTNDEIATNENDMFTVLHGAFRYDREMKKRHAEAKLKANSSQVAVNTGCGIIKLALIAFVLLAIFGLFMLIYLWVK